MRSREDVSINELCAALAILDGQPATIVDRPDRDPETPGGCDALIGRLGRTWAVEHTTFDSFPDQRLDDARLNRSLLGAVERIGRAFPDFWISISVAAGAVSTGTSWAELSQRFESEAKALIASRSTTNLRWSGSIAGIESAVSVRPSSRPGAYLGRLVSNDAALFRSMIATAVKSKRAQLEPYHVAGMPTILLLDNDDIGQMNPAAWAEAFAAASENLTLDWLDETFLVDGTERPPWLYPVKLGDRRYPSLPEFDQFFERQSTATYGLMR